MTPHTAHAVKKRREDIAAAVHFFATCPPHITGQVLRVDGSATGSAS